jgi:two-component system NtrC family sensor kinase
MKSMKDSIINLLEKRMKRYHLPLMPVIWGVTCLIIGGLVAIGLYGYHSAEKAVATQFNNQQWMLAQQAARGIENFLSEIRATATLITHIPEVQNFVHGKGIHEKTLRSLYESLGGKVNFLRLENSQGELLAAYPPQFLQEEAGKTFHPGSYFQKVRSTGKPVMTDLILHERGKNPGDPQFLGFILIAVPIFRSSEFLGILSCGLDFKKVNALYLDSIRSGFSGGFWMINQEGRFIAHYEPEFLGRNAFTARKERNPALDYERIDQIMKEKMLQGKTGTDEYISGWHRGERGKIKKLIAYAPVSMDDQIWSVAVVAPYSEVTQVVWASFKNSALLLLIMACTLLAGTYVGHKINQGRIRAEEKVKWGEEIVRSQDRLQTLFDGAPDAITIVDRNFRISMVNKTGLNWSKKSPEYFIGKICHQEFQKRSDLCPNCPAEESFRTGKPAFRERASLIADGTKRYLQLYTFPLGKRNGEVVEVVEYVKDVTAEKELHEQIVQSERLAVVGRMSASVAHEIKNPLGTIVLNAELLEEELARFGAQDSAEARDLLGVIKKELDHLIEVVDEYLQFARLPKVKAEKGNLNEVIDDLLLFLREEATDRKIEIVEEKEASLPPVAIDAKQLRQAFLNLVKNSFEAMPGGGKLTVSTASHNGQVEVTIADTGKGIAEENLERVFTPFFSTKHGGTGLGLAITSHIIQGHRGTISLKSYQDLGTIFTIRLPALPGDGTPGEK